MFDETEPVETRFQCRHILTNGLRCQSPCLKSSDGPNAAERHESFCYYHHTTRHPATGLKARRARQSTFEMPIIEDRSAIQAALGEILSRIATNDLDPRRAGLLLYGLQIATLTMPPHERSARSGSRSRSVREPDHIPTVVETTEDPVFGLLALETPYRAPDEAPVGHKTLGRRLMEELDLMQAKAKAAQEAREKAEAEARQKAEEEATQISPETDEINPEDSPEMDPEIQGKQENEVSQQEDEQPSEPTHPTILPEIQAVAAPHPRPRKRNTRHKRALATNGSTTPSNHPSRSDRPARSRPVRQDSPSYPLVPIPYSLPHPYLSSLRSAPPYRKYPAFLAPAVKLLA